MCTDVVPRTAAMEVVLGAVSADGEGGEKRKDAEMEVAEAEVGMDENEQEEGEVVRMLVDDGGYFVDEDDAMEVDG